MLAVKNLGQISFEELYEGFREAFVDYPERLTYTLSQFRYLLERRGYDPLLSFGVFIDNHIVGFILNAFGYYRGQPTAYDACTGIVREHRHKGLASLILNESLPAIKETGARQYLTEVIKTNKDAIDLYKKKGFGITREYDYYIANQSDIDLKKKDLPEGYAVARMIEPDWELFNSFWDFQPSWQNSPASVKRKWEKFCMVGVSHGDQMVGYGLIERHTGDIPHFAIDPKHRRKGLGTILFSELLSCSEVNEVRVVNTDANVVSVRKFMESLNFVPGTGQYEMLLRI
jgi:ribosomal protein S18 acetylase RimI-like enzyme